MKFIKIFIPTLLIALLIPASQISAQEVDPNQNVYMVVINHEEQYSIIPFSQKIPKGWKRTKYKGELPLCMEYIEEVWTDMRPLSVRKRMLPDDTKYKVVINHEEQYSIIPASQALPKSYKTLGIEGNLNYCQNYIEEVWTDMRPLSLRKKKE